MRLRLTCFVILVGAILLLPGCARRRPATTADQGPTELPVATTTTEAPAGGEASPDAADPFAGDLEAVNRYVRDQGLLGDVHFAYDSFELAAEARQRLADNASFLKRHPQFEVVIEGHCDERGTPEYNLALGERRASGTRGYLGALGIDESRLRTLSYGKERPLCTEQDENCWWRNRRAHFMISGRREAG